MKIRSITYFCNPGSEINLGILQLAGEFINLARQAYETAGFEVQTVRLATPPFSRLLPAYGIHAIVQWAQSLEQASNAQGYSYLSIGPALPENPNSFAVLPEVIGATTDTFTAGIMTLDGGGISLPAVNACAEIIRSNASLDPKGFANLRFAALANVPPGSPFFPAAYHDGEKASFALATEAADLAVQAFSLSDSLVEAQNELANSIEAQAQALAGIGDLLAKKTGATFKGIDFSLAPFPTEALSLGTALERMGVPSIGLHGSLAAAAILTEAIDRANFPRTGFSGLFTPVLEDFILATRAAEGILTVTDLLLYAAVCGTGLDTIPLPGDVSSDQIAPILLDLAVMAQRLNKPLTARLMPLPGKLIGDPTDFDFAFFAPSRVMAIRASPLKGFLAGVEDFNLKTRSPR